MAEENRSWSLADAPESPSDVAVGILRFGVPDRPVNLLTEATLAELGERLDDAARAGYGALVVISGKPGTFIAGADVEAIAAVESPKDGAAKAAAGQAILRRLASTEMPAVAAVDGACVGGGAELAAWCSARVAAAGDRTRIGFPEVRLGIVPGFGGTQRLPGVVGLATALQLVTTGRLLAPRAAFRAGLVDSVVPPEHLLAEAVALAVRLGSGHRRRRFHWSNVPVARDVVSRLAARRVGAATGGRLPAPVEAVRLCRLSLDTGLTDGLAEEARAVGRLLVTPSCRSFLHLHELTRRSKKLGQTPPEDALAGVVGAGVMGAGIAAVAAASGHRARVADVRAEALGSAARSIERTVRRAKRNAERPRVAAARAFDQVSFALSHDGFRAADLVVEAVVEREDVKRAVLREIEAAVGDDCVIATNTSSLGVGPLAGALDRPERFVGLHFFNPVARMPLVEVVPGPSTTSEVVERAVGWARALGKHPVVVADAPGFLVNRILMPYLAEALELHEQGVDPRAVDAAATDFGMPMGPFRLLDEVGLDVAAEVSRTFSRAFPERFGASERLDGLVDEGRLGKKAGRGFYVHGRRGKPRLARDQRRSGAELSPLEIQDRLFLRMADEALRCLDEGVAASADDVDLATVMGMGFPPERGGLCRWIETVGRAELRKRLQALARRLGDRFEPCAAWAEAAAPEPPGRSD